MTNDAAVAWYYEFGDTGEAGPVTFGGDPGREAIEWAERYGHTLHYLAPATTVAELRAEVERLQAYSAHQEEVVAQRNLDWYTEKQRADAAERRVAECLKFIAGVRDELHNRRTADWYPEGAHNAAEQMSEDMRLIGNSCADFDPDTLRQEKLE